MFAAAIQTNPRNIAAFAQARVAAFGQAPVIARSNNSFTQGNVVKADRLSKPESFKAYRKARTNAAGKGFRRQQAKADLREKMAARGMNSQRAQQIEDTFTQLLGLLG